MRTIVCGFFVFALVTLSAAAEDARLLSVSGEAMIRVVPDEVVIGVGVETFDPLLDNAKKKNDESDQASPSCDRRVGHRGQARAG